LKSFARSSVLILLVLLSACATTQRRVSGVYLWSFGSGSGPATLLRLVESGEFERTYTGCDICPESIQAGTWQLVGKSLNLRSYDGSWQESLYVAHSQGRLVLAPRSQVVAGAVPEHSVYKRIQ
jgi:hypothetical protein